MPCRIKGIDATVSAATSAANTLDMIMVFSVSTSSVPDNPAALRDLADRFADKLKSGIVVLGCVVGRKVLLIAKVTKDLTKLYHAGNIIKAVAAEVGGGGGGRPDMAQAGGSRPENLDVALKRAHSVIEGGD